MLFFSHQKPTQKLPLISRGCGHQNANINIIKQVGFFSAATIRCVRLWICSLSNTLEMVSCNCEYNPSSKNSVSLLSSLVSTVERAQVDEGEYFTSTTEFATVEEKTEIIVEERKLREEEVCRTPEIPPPQTITEREDDWLVLLDVVPRESSYVPPGTANIPCTASLLYQSKCLS